MMDKDYAEDSLEKLISMANAMESSRTDDKFIYDTLKYILHGFDVFKKSPGYVNAPYRNQGIKAICKQLNRLQDEMQFEKPYTVVYHTDHNSRR